MHKIRVSLGSRSYNIVIGLGLVDECGPILKRLDIGTDAFIVTNKPISRLYGKRLERSLTRAGITAHIETVPDSERSKSLARLTGILNRVSVFDENKRVFIAAFGGGVVGDLAGFASAVYKRGIAYAQIPTTLLAQVDSAIGGKTAVDLPAAKNLAGAFHQPRIVISDISLIRSLSGRQFRNGLAEVIKYGVIKDLSLFGYLERNFRKILGREESALEYIISRSSAIKASIVERDEFDTKGLRAVLNYGHTVGHAIETASGYSKRYAHGEAVAVGMAAAARIAVNIGLMKVASADRIERLIRLYGLPTKMQGVAVKRVYAALLHDKKFYGTVKSLVLPTRIGSVKVVKGLPEGAIKEILSSSVERR